MTFQRKLPEPDAKPKWALEDVTMDITEVVGETFPGVFDEGDNLVGFLRRQYIASDVDDDNPLTFNGMSIEDTCGTIYRDREWCLKVFGIRFVWGLEEAALTQELVDRGEMV